MIEAIFIYLILGLCFTGWLNGKLSIEGFIIEPQSAFFTILTWPIVLYNVILYGVDKEEDD